jgi:LysM repeat protein
MFVRVVLLLTVAAFAVAVAARRSSGAQHPVTYVVKPGDTLWNIASTHYAGDPRQGVWAIERRNHLPGPAIQPGDRLVVPAG